MLISSFGCDRALTTALVGASVALTTLPAFAADLTLNLQGLKSDDGKIMIAIYEGREGFSKRKSFKASIEVPKSPAMMVRVGELPPGEYAILAFQDKNGNQKLDRYFFGLPKEPWAGSLKHMVFGPPQWEDIRFTMPLEGGVVEVRF